MFTLITVNLSEDWREVQPYLGQIERGQFRAEDLLRLLEQFRRNEAVQNSEVDAYLIIVGARSRHLVRTTQGRLVLYDVGAAERGGTEMSAERILEHVSSQGPSFSGVEEEEVQELDTKARRATHRWIAIGMLVIGLGLNGYTLYSAFYFDDVNKTPPLMLINDQREVQDTRLRLAGTYTTGDEPGERAIVVETDGKVKIYLLGANGSLVSPTAYEYRPGKRENRLFLAVHGLGQIEVVTREKLILFGDSYLRSR